MNSLIIALISLMVIAMGGISDAALVNGDFETGNLDGWQLLGTGSIVDMPSGLKPTEGKYQVLLENHPALGNHGVPAVEIEKFIDAVPGSLSNLGHGQVIQGTALRQIICLANERRLTYTVNFLTQENEYGIESSDFGFLSVQPGTLSVISGIDSAVLPAPASLYPKMSGYVARSIVLEGPGTFTLSFGVVDVDNNFGGSALLVDAVSFPESVP